MSMLGGGQYQPNWSDVCCWTVDNVHVHQTIQLFNEKLNKSRFGETVPLNLTQSKLILQILPMLT